MIEAWLPITLAAAFLQNMRSALQKHLKGRLTTLGAAYVRFLYCWPFALLYLCGLHYAGGLAWPSPSPIFYLYCVLGGVAQIVFTVLLIYLFSFRNFTVGTTFSKTEIVMVAILGFVVLGDRLTLIAGLAILVAAIGVMALSIGQTRISPGALLRSLAEKPTLIGLASGACLGGSVVFFRGAGLSLQTGEFVMAAGFTLAISVVIQTVIMGVYIGMREPGTLKAVMVHWKWSLAVGVTGAATSVAWFTAFTMQNAAYVRAVGQIELVFTFVASVFFFKERTSRLEVFGILLVVAAILLLLLGR